MFNGVGIPTPRGTGTSGYVQKSLAFIKQKPKNNSYKEVLNKFKEDPTPVRNTINEDILKHEILFKIESELLELKRQNKDKFTSDKELEEFLSKERSRLEKENLVRNIIDDNNSKRHLNTHQYNLMQEEKNKKIKQAFGISDQHVFGEAFDIELQEEKIRKQKEERRIEKNEKEKAKLKEIEKYEKDKLKKKRKEKELILLLELEKKEIELERQERKRYRDKESDKDKERFKDYKSSRRNHTRNRSKSRSRTNSSRYNKSKYTKSDFRDRKNDRRSRSRSSD